jgi:RecA/RadA recombinase
VRQSIAKIYQAVSSFRPPVLDPQHVRLPLVPPALDVVLGGGLPCGVITEVVGGVSSGRTTFAQALISAVTHAGEFAAWVDLPNAFDPDCARTAGIDLERMLWMAPVDRIGALRATEQVIDAGGFRVVVLDLDGPSFARSVISTSAWLRIGRVAARRNAAIVVIGAEFVTGAFAALSLEMRQHRRIFVGQRGPCPVFEGATSSLWVRRFKFGPQPTTSIELFAAKA